jgi:uncharacterized protein YgfB (UPF0149 family)
LSILDAHPSDAPSSRFDDVANALLEQGQFVSPAELHGCLCGLLGGGFDGDDSALVAELEGTLDAVLHGPLVDEVIALRDDAVDRVTEGHLDFFLLLPEEELELELRIGALAGWCRAFLSGFAQARVAASAAAEVVATDSAEALRDFAAIAQAAGEDEGRDADEREDDYLELLEYVRVAAMNVLMDARAAAATP